MSVRWISWAWDQECSNAAEKLVLIALADHAGEDGEAWPASARLEEKTGISRSSVFRHLARLEEGGFIEREHRFRDDGSQTSSVIHLREGGVNLTRGGRTSDTPGVAPVTREGVAPVTPLEPSDMNRHENQEEPPYPPLAIVDGRFDEFWDLYPKGRKVAKPKAEKIYNRLMKTVDHEDIIMGLRRWLVYWKHKNEPEFVPHPTTWLNQERWNDEPPPLTRRTTTSMQAKNDYLDRLRRVAAGEYSPQKELS